MSPGCASKKIGSVASIKYGCDLTIILIGGCLSIRAKDRSLSNSLLGVLRLIDISEDKYNEVMWAQYESDIELYKFYVNFVLKINAFHYAMSAAIFSYLLAHKTEQYLQILLAFPIIFSIAIIVISIKGYPRVKDLNRGMALKVEYFNLPICPDFTTLRILIGASIVILYIH